MSDWWNDASYNSGNAYTWVPGVVGPVTDQRIAAAVGTDPVPDPAPVMVDATHTYTGTTERAGQLCLQLATSPTRTHVRWADGSTSYVAPDNLEPLVPPWTDDACMPVDHGRCADCGHFIHERARVVYPNPLWSPPGCDCNTCRDNRRRSEALSQREGEAVRIGDRLICERCCDANYRTCTECSEWLSIADVHATGDGYQVCESCLEANFERCERCDEWYGHYSGHTHEAYCEDCGVEYDEDEGHRCGCECDAPRPVFEFPAGEATVANDERLTVEMPAGSISEAGIQAIRDVVYYGVRELPQRPRPNVYEALDVVGALEPIWQTRRGNFTRRLSSALHKKLGVKLSPATITNIGNLARQHSSDAASVEVEFTRDLNLDASEFCNEGSCWWGSMSYSRCALKNWGGLGMRTFNDYGVTGRVWVQPLDEDLQPTHDTLGAFAYVLYNGYGDLSGFVGTRIVAHLTGKTYKRIGLEISRQYVNAGGHLVADEATCAATEGLRFDFNEHDTFDAHSFDRKAAA